MWSDARVLVHGFDYILPASLFPGGGKWRWWQWQESSLKLCSFPRKETALEALQWPEDEAVAVATGAWEPLVASRR